MRTRPFFAKTVTFVKACFPAGLQVQQAKHSSKYISKFHGISLWKTLAESPDFKQIKKLIGFFKAVLENYII